MTFQKELQREVVQVNKINIFIFVVLREILFCSENSWGWRKGKVGTLLIGTTILNLIFLIILQKTVLSRTSSIELVKSKTLLLQKTEEVKVNKLALKDAQNSINGIYFYQYRRKHQHLMLKHLKPLNLKSKSTHPHLQYRQENLFLLKENRLKTRNHFKLYSIVLFISFVPGLWQENIKEWR